MQMLTEYIDLYHNYCIKYTKNTTYQVDYENR